MKSRKINYRAILINLALMVIPILLVALLYPILPVIQLPHLDVNDPTIRTLDKHVYYILALIPIFVYYKIKRQSEDKVPNQKAWLNLYRCEACFGFDPEDRRGTNPVLTWIVDDCLITYDHLCAT
jgi:hypothetical protein